jgi:hypothetical protein
MRNFPAGGGEPWWQFTVAHIFPNLIRSLAQLSMRVLWRRSPGLAPLPLAGCMEALGVIKEGD